MSVIGSSSMLDAVLVSVIQSAFINLSLYNHCAVTLSSFKAALRYRLMPNGSTQAPPGSPVAQAPAPKKSRFVSIVIISACMVLLIAFLLVTFWPTTNDCGTDRQCFLNQAIGCLQADYHAELNGTVIRYSTDKCIVIVKVEKVGAIEPKELRDALEGKSMRCDISQGIDDTFLDFPPPLDNCTGPLSDEIAAARLALMVG
jgi:hypothetical protein